MLESSARERNFICTDFDHKNNRYQGQFVPFDEGISHYVFFSLEIAQRNIYEFGKIFYSGLIPGLDMGF